jgi:AraC-like DNA-binding protein
MFYLDPAQMAEMAKVLDPNVREMPFIPAGAVWDPALAERIANLHRYCEEPGAEPLERQTRLSMIIEHVLRCHSVARMDRLPRKMRSEVQVARRVIDETFEYPIHLNELAVLAGMNPYGLVRCFTQELGIPPHAYLVQIRIQRAALLLRQGVSLARTALEVGFSDQSHLNRHFLKRYGITPGAYRKAFRP